MNKNKWMKRMFVFAACAVLSMTMMVGCGKAAGTGDISKITDFDENYVPTETKEVLYLKGSWSEIGFQYATEAETPVKITLASNLGDAIDRYGSFDAAVDEAQPILDYIEEKAPLLIELWKGMATGLGVDYNVVAVGSISYTAPDKNCSTLAAWGKATEDGRMLVGSNHDTNFYENINLPAVVVYPEEGNAFISSCGFTPNMLLNDKGLVVTGSSGQAGAPGDHGYGLPTMTALLVLAATCDNAEQAKDAVLDGVATGAGDNVHVSDVNGNDYIIEHTAQKDVVRQAGDYGEKDYTIATNNFLAKELEGSLYKGDEYWDDCMPRYWTEEQVLKEEGIGKITLDTINNAIGCDRYYVDPEWYDYVWEQGNFVGYKKIENGEWVDKWDLTDTCTGFWSPENKEPGTKCLQRALADPANATLYMMKGGKNTLVSINPEATGNFTRVTLTKKPKDSVAIAKDEARKQIFRAARDLDEKADTAKEKKLNQAKKYLLQGDNMTYKAMCATERTERLTNFGKAATLYCKAQAYAQLAQKNTKKVVRDGEDYIIW